MRIERDFRNQEYKVIISRDELIRAFETPKRLSNLINEIGEVIWKEREEHCENLFR